MTQSSSDESFEAEDRRKFLETCGRFAAVTPPTIMMLLSTSLTSQAIALSSGGISRGNGNGNANGNRKSNNGFGNGGDDGSPNGNKEDTDR